ncbi:alpha-2-macroglobulin family protein [Commensalibacter papalotli (ex Servin-Garciduenas et al. 2014)]|uniref:Alpha-2-macroglobulin domain-containing protein n=1 Tax=Commensalibacter papalotli (ex Servin-Garciduenas et al. 2014) TaxID=1208583 RepID=W7DUG9_9PROT|nr:alpha-2-macroglobulin [Commensalibacter papalotli (ex Servin-Garciduenas et al. 2014)]EUK17913.1 alpha-2-macroglobulin domain-containing protein [Commensalibacter papalotli (ex Servin-Garciduenas et al. 2014)]
MQFLQFLCLLPIKILRFLWKSILFILRPIIGQVNFTWSAPTWMAPCRKNKKLFAYGIPSFLVMIALGYSGIYWYQHRPIPPIPNLVKIYAIAPSITDYKKTPPTIYPLRINFSGSAAPLNKMGKKFPNLFPITPEIKGVWQWTSDHALSFQPQTDWNAGQTYSINFTKPNEFNPNVIIRSAQDINNTNPTVKFTTVAFDAKLNDKAFQQDDQHPMIKKGIFTLSFNMLVDPISFEKNIHLSLVTYTKKKNTSLFSGDKDKEIIEKTEQKIPFNVIYDKQKLTATIASENLPIPNDNSKLELTIDPGTTSQLGHGNLTNKITASVNVPSKYTLTINDLSTHIVTDEKNTSDQILEVKFNSPVNDEQVAKNISAWILPALSDRDEPWNTKTLTPQTISHFTPLKLTLIPAENNAQAIQSFKYKTDPNQQILVKINVGIQSTGGYILNNPHIKILNTPDYPKRLNFMSDGALLSLHGSNKVSVASQNLTGVKMVIGQLRPNQIQHLVSFRDSDENYNKVNFKSPFTKDHIINRYQQKISFGNKPSHDIRYDGFDLSSYLHKGLHGVFILHLSEYDQKAERKEKQAKRQRDRINSQRTFAIGNTPSNIDDNDSDEEESSLSDSRLIVITDLGMIVKKSLDGSQDVFIQSINSGSPVANAEVSVMGLNGDKLITKTTDDSGIVHFPNLQGFTKDKLPTLYIVNKDDDLSFLPINTTNRSLDFSRFNVGGDINTIHKKEISAYLFSDRGIYRTGEDFHIGMVIKTADWQNSIKNLPLKMIITDPTGKSYESAVTVGQDGFNEYTNTIGENDPNGTWQISLLTIDPKDKDWSQEIGSTTIKVKDFLPEQTRVSAEFSANNPKGWVKPEQLKAIVQAKNLFGTPAGNRRVEASIKVSPFVPQFEQWKDYQFSIADRLKESFEDTLQEEKTNDQGKATFDLNLKKYTNSSYSLSFLGQVYEPDSGRSVAATAQTIVSSNNYMVGYHSTDDISNIKINSAVKAVHLIAINQQVKLIPLPDLKIRLIEKRYVSVLVKQSSGLYKYESKPRETILSETPFSIDKNGSDYSINTNKAGDYKAVVLDKDNNELNTINFSIIGAGNLSRSLERNAELNISLNKKTYKPGEEIEVAIRAPYIGSGLITIEKDKVYAHTWFHTDTTSSIQHITVPPELDGNGYINVQFVRDPSSDEIFMSPLSYGVVPFSINLEQHQNALTITAPEITKDRKITFTVTSERPTRVILWAVDKGILQVSKYKLPNPLGYFFSKKMLDVQTLQILDQILPEFSQLLKVAAAAGGDEDSPFTQRVNPFKRKQDKPVVFWSGIVDINGSRDFTYDAPDYFNGTLQVMALSVSDEQIGVTSKESIVRDDFVLKPNAPTTLTPGDESEVSVLVANNLDKLNGQKVPVSVSLKTTSQFQVIGNNIQTLSLGEKQDSVVQFRIKALNRNLGSGDLIFSVNYNQSITRNTTHVLLRPASTYRTQVNMNKLDAGATKTFTDLRSVYPNNALHYASFSNLPMVIIQGLGTYLMDYEHLCSEQIVSRAFALLTIQNKPELKNIFAQTDPNQVKNLNASLDQIITTLQERQNSAGAFGLWRSTPNADNFVTSYVTFFLQNAADQGKNVSQSALNKAYAYLKDYAVNGSNDNLTDMRNKAFAIYILTKQGNVTTSAISSLVKDLNTKYKESWKQDSTAAWLAASMKLMKQDEAAGQMMAESLKRLQRDPKASNIGWNYEGYDGGDLAQDATILYLVSQHFPSLLPNLSENAFTNILSTIEQGYYNTLSSSLTVMAFDAYSANIKDDTKNLLIQAMGTDSQKQSTILKTSQLKNGIQILNWQQGPTTSLSFNNQSSIKAWYSVIQRGFDQNPPKTALQQKMEIIRDYTDQKNNPVSDVKVGQEILVHVKFRSTDNKTHNNIAITDLLPGGFDLVADKTEAVDSTTENNSFYPDFINKQEDKVMIYTSVTKNIQEYVYRIKATNAGKYIIPPAYGEGMYNPTIQARSLSGGYLAVTSAK